MALMLSLHATIRCDHAGLPKAQRRPFGATLPYKAKPAARRTGLHWPAPAPACAKAHHQPMLDHCLVLRKNGVLLWRQSWAPMKGNPVDDLIRTMLMEVAPCPLPD